MNDFVYVPSFDNGNCVTILNSNTLRVFESSPTYGTQINYKDYYIKSDYLYDTGSVLFNTGDLLPTCIDNDRVTTEVFYRYDFPSILFIFVVLAFISFWLPWKLITKMLGRWNH